MFSFFKKAGNPVQVDDHIWMNEQQKMKALLNMAKENTATVFVCWFDETFDKLTQLFTNSGITADSIYVARTASHQQLQHAPIVFAEHHPLQEKEQAFYKQLQLKTATVHSALDEPILQKFGGERVVSLMQSLGVAETESLQHKLISASIKNAQEKLAKKITVEQPVRSQQEWMERNAD